MRRDKQHPDWCGRNHVCTAAGPRGEHRSYPMTVDVDAGRLVVTRIRTRTGRDQVELRMVVDVPADPVTAQRAVRGLVMRLCHAINPTAKVGRHGD